MSIFAAVSAGRSAEAFALLESASAVRSAKAFALLESAFALRSAEAFALPGAAEDRIAAGCGAEAGP
jgi:hypothetical protein